MKLERKIRKLVILLICVMAMILAFSISVSAATCSIQINGKTIRTDAPPMIENGRTLVPVATIVDYLGGKAEWQGETHSVTLKYGNKVVKLKIGEKIATVNGKSIAMDAAPKIVTVDKFGGGRTMVPIRLISESFGYKVGWDEKNRIVSITVTGKNDPAKNNNEDVKKVTIKNKILGLSVSGGEKIPENNQDTYTVVKITGEKSLRNNNSQDWLQGPIRYFIDFKETTASGGINTNIKHESQNSSVGAVRLGHPSEGITRVAIDLSGKVQPVIYYLRNDKVMCVAFRENPYRWEAPKKKPHTPEKKHEKTPIKPDPVPETPVVTNINDDINRTIPYNPYADGELVVCLDPGHGSTTMGKRSPDSTLMEWEFNRSLAYKLKPLLEANGIKVIVTVPQEEMSDPPLSDRVAFSNNAGNVDLFVSIHSNASGIGHWSTPEGWEVYSWKKGTIAEDAAKALKKATIASGLFKMRGTKTANFYVIKNTTSPAILIEHGFFTNYEECQRLKEDSFRNQIAQADCNGIVSFFNSYK